jgi:lysylphosphatidylglycerol synthetase-like protein (DUF2156 family)
MRNLDGKIAEWRTRMAAGGIKAPAVLDELEGHLREDVEREMRAGRDAVVAFEMAVARIGRSDLLRVEFGKIKEPRKQFGKIVGIACCVFTSLYSLLLAPHLITIRELSAMERILGLSAVAVTWISLAGLRFSYKLLPAIHNKRTGTLTVATCALIAVAWLFIFSDLLPNVIVPHALRDISVNAPVDALRAVFAVGISLLWAMAFAAMLGAAAYGLEEAAQRSAKEHAYVRRRNQIGVRSR